MNQDDAKLIADTIGAVIARERKAMRAELETAIAGARTALLAEARAMIAVELEKMIARVLLGSPSQPQQLRGATGVVTLPSRRSA